MAGRLIGRITKILPVLLLCVSTGASFAAEQKIAVFDFELIDTSLQGELQGTPQADLDRLGLISDKLREMLDASDRYAVIDIAPAAALIADAGYLHSCNKCATKIAGPLGAELAFTGTVQKVSNLILNINVYLHDVASGDTIGGTSVDIRGNTDNSWTRGISYLVRNRILK